MSCEPGNAGSTQRHQRNQTLCHGCLDVLDIGRTETNVNTMSASGLPGRVPDARATTLEINCVLKCAVTWRSAQPLGHASLLVTLATFAYPSYPLCRFSVHPLKTNQFFKPGDMFLKCLHSLSEKPCVFIFTVSLFASHLSLPQHFPKCFLYLLDLFFFSKKSLDVH